MTDTVLQIIGMGVPLYSARGLTQTLTPIEASKVLRRTINGALRDLSYSQFRKYTTRISCTDQRPPALDAIWPGREVTVYCVAQLATAATAGPERPVVPGSEYVEEGFTYYCPILEMRVMGFSDGIEEWHASVPWELELEEI